MGEKITIDCFDCYKNDKGHNLYPKYLSIKYNVIIYKCTWCQDYFYDFDLIKINHII